MADFIASGRLIDVILVLLAAELAGLAFLRFRFGRGPGIAALAATFASGACLLLAMRNIIHSGGWEITAGWLAAAFAAHLADIAMRWRS